MVRVLTLFTLLTAALSAQEPVLLAGEARLWLKVPADQAPLGEVRISPGAARTAAWETNPAVRVRLTDLTVPLRWWDWTPITIRFTPAADGAVDLDLNGPWLPEKDGVMPKQVVWWDDLTATGTALVNGGFEDLAEAGPVGWRSPWAQYAPPPAGTFGRTGRMHGENAGITPAANAIGTRKVTPKRSQGG